MLNRPHILLNKPTLLFFQKHKPRSCQYNAILKTGKFRLGGTPGCLSCKQVVRQGCWESWVVLYPLSKTHKGGHCTLSSLGSCSHRQNVHLCAWVEPAVFQLTPAVSCLLLCAAVNPWSSGSAPILDLVALLLMHPRRLLAISAARALDPRAFSQSPALQSPDGVTRGSSFHKAAIWACPFSVS